MRAKPYRTLTPLAMAVLRLLSTRPMHPYEMHQLVRDHGTDRVIKVRAGSLYHTVERLHRQELIEPVETGRDGRRPERTVYAITGTGRDEFVTNLRDLLRVPAEEFPLFAAALEMVSALPPATVRQLLEMRAVALEAQMAAYEQALGTLAKTGLERFHLIETEFGLATNRAELGFVRRIIADIDSGDLTWSSTDAEPGSAGYLGETAGPPEQDRPDPTSLDQPQPGRPRSGQPRPEQSRLDHSEPAGNAPATT